MGIRFGVVDVYLLFVSFFYYTLCEGEWWFGGLVKGEIVIILDDWLDR